MPPGVSALKPLAWILVGLIGTAGNTPGVSGEPDELRLEEAMYVEITLADPDAAIRLYREILGDPSAATRVRAEAGLRLANCYRLLGDDPKARTELESVIGKFPREEKVVDLARRYLGERVTLDPSRFMPPDVLAYFELVDPARQLQGVQDLLAGTPFQNPVDYYVSYLARRSEDSEEAGDAARRSVSPVSAFLNEGFLSEVQKIEGLAACLPYPRESERDFLLAFLPGSSDILRGLVQMLLTISDARGCGQIDGIPLLRFPPQRAEPSPRTEDQWPHVALGDSFVVLGSPRRCVEEAVSRYRNGASSLADDPDFRNAQAARAGSVLFSYIHRERALTALSDSLPEVQRTVFEATRQALHLDDLRAVSFTVSQSHASDSLRLTFRARVNDTALEELESFRTPFLDPLALERVPVGSPGFLAFRLSTADQARVLRSRLRQSLKSQTRNPEAVKLLELLDREATGEVLDRLDTVVLGAGPRTVAPPSLAGFLVLGFRNDGASTTLERFLGEALFLIFKTPASREFHDDVMPVDGVSLPVRYVEPVSGLRLLCLWTGRTATLAFAPANLWTSARLETGSPAGRFADLPSRARKVLFLRPEAFASDDVGDESLPLALRAVLGSIARAFVVTREGRDSLSVEVVVPDLTRAVRGALEALAART